MSTDTAPAATLRGHHVFRLLWAADTVAQHGTFAATAIIPLLAATTLAATPMQMGMLAAAEMAAFLVLGLPAGAWIDRRRRRPILITADLTRAALLLTIPAAALLGVLTLAQLIIAAVAVGAASVFFDVAYQAYLPTAIGEEHLVAGYANLQATQSVGQAAGPGIGGLLTQVTGAANALAVTGLGYLSSAALISRIRTPEPAPPPPAEQARLRTEIGEGLRCITAHPQLRALTIASATAAFFNGSARRRRACRGVGGPRPPQPVARVRRLRQAHRADAGSRTRQRRREPETGRSPAPRRQPRPRDRPAQPARVRSGGRAGRGGLVLHPRSAPARRRHRHHARAVRRWQRHQSINQGSRLTDP
jgi:hypothetical protein